MGVMGFNLAVLALVQSGPAMDPSSGGASVEAAGSTVRSLFPRTPYAHSGPATLLEGGFPPRGHLNVGQVGSTQIIATRDACLFNPTKLHRRYLRWGSTGTMVLLTQQSVYDMFAYARWEDGDLVRSISINPVGGLWEDIGVPEPFELPFWDEAYPVPDDYPLPFHPLEMSDSALRDVLHLHYESPPGPGLHAPEDVVLQSFSRESARS